MPRLRVCGVAASRYWKWLPEQLPEPCGIAAENSELLIGFVWQCGRFMACFVGSWSGGRRRSGFGSCTSGL
jgi:hypothetical protein